MDHPNESLFAGDDLPVTADELESLSDRAERAGQGELSLILMAIACAAEIDSEDPRWCALKGMALDATQSVVGLKALYDSRRRAIDRN